MTIILDLRFAILDRGINREEVTAKSAKAKSLIFALSAFFAAIHFGWFRSLRFAQEGVVKPVKVERAKNRPCNPLMVKGVKPSQGKSNQLGLGVKVAGQVAKIAGLVSGQSWQYVTPAGRLADNIWQGVPAIVSYCQIKSPVVMYGQISRRKKFAPRGHPAESPSAVLRGQIQLDTLVGAYHRYGHAHSAPARVRASGYDCDTRFFWAALRGEILRFEVLALNLE